MKKWNVPLTYAPKIPLVKSGECTQTIRPGRKYSVGDLIRFYTWQGKPYRSKREKITGYMKVMDVEPIILCKEGIWSYRLDQFFQFSNLHGLAKLDGIVPPTGEELGRVLLEKNRIPEDGVKAQIVRWKY